MAELKEVHKFWTGREVLIVKGKHAGKLGYCHGPCACYFYDVYVYDTQEMTVLEEGSFEDAEMAGVTQNRSGGERSTAAQPTAPRSALGTTIGNG